MRIPNCSSHYFCVTVLVVKEVVHLPIRNELAAYQSRYHSSEDVFHRGKSEHWHLSHYHSSLTLWYPPQLSTKICMKPQAKVYPTYRMHQAPLPYYDFIPNLAYCHHSQNSLFKGYKGFKSPPKIKTCITNFIWHFFFFQQFSISKLLKSYTRSIFYYLYFQQTLMNIWKIIFHNH